MEFVYGSILDPDGIFSRFISFSVRKRTGVRFWLHSWCGHKVLKDVFPILYSIA